MMDFIMERTETFEIKTQTTTLRVVEGVCQVIEGISFVVMMTKPYHGLWCGEHFWIDTTPYTHAEVKSRATHLLKRLGEQCIEVEYHYDKYKELLNGLERYTECVRQHRDEAMAYMEKKEELTDLQSKAFSFYLEGLGKEELYYYDKMIDEYQLPWISLRSLKNIFQLLKISICVKNSRIMIVVDKQITVVVNGETAKGVIRRACCSMVEVWMVAPQWCGGVRRTDFIKLKKPTRQELIEYGENILRSLYDSCKAIREHKTEIVEAENEYNKKWKRLNERSNVIRENIRLLKKEIEEGKLGEAFNEKQNLLRKYRSVLFRLSCSKSRLIYSFITDFYKQIEVDNLLYAINRICETRFMSNNVNRKGIWKLQK